MTGVGPTTFYQNVENHGDIHISTSSFAVFLDEVSGDGTITGEGTAIYEAGTSMMASIINPGNSLIQLPATLKADVIRQNSMTVRGTVELTGSGIISTLNILSIESAGKMDLGANDLAILDGASLTYEALRDWVNSDQLFTSSISGTHPTTLAIIDNLHVHKTSWNGLSLGTEGADFDQFILKYTYVGDVNCDGVVDDQDILAVLCNLGHPGQYVNGDINYDGMVNLIDLNLVKANFGAGNGLTGGQPLNAVIAVPEPAALALLSIASLSLLARRRRMQ